MSQTQTEGVIDAVDTGSTWSSLYIAGGWAALAIVLLMVIQIIVFVASPPPNDVRTWFALFQENWLLGLLNLDILYLVTNILLVPIYLALYASLKRVSETATLIALALGLMGVTAYFASNTAFEMWALSNQHASAATEAEKAVALAAGQAMLAIYKGTAFDVYYILDAVFLLVISVVMLRSEIFSKATAYSGLLSGLLMAVPSTVGTIGPYFALASLAPWAVFSVLVARKLFRLGRKTRGGQAELLSRTL